MPGCGLSKFDPIDWAAYSTDALAALLKAAIERCQAVNGRKGVVLIGHSMGCSQTALLASSNPPPASRLQCSVLALVSICPKISPPTAVESTAYRRILSLPDPVLDAARWIDRRGGTESASVLRFVGKDADIDLKKLQQRFNAQFPTAVWKRTAYGCLPRDDSAGLPYSGLAGENIWSGVNVPLLLIAGDSDIVARPEEVAKIVASLHPYAESHEKSGQTNTKAVPDDAAQGVKTYGRDGQLTVDDVANGTSPFTTSVTSRHAAVVKTAILPAPAAHALLYDHATYRTVSGLIKDFLEKHVSRNLDLGWQLQHLTTSGKWWAPQELYR